MNAIEARALSKQYRVGGRERYVALRDVLTNAVGKPIRALRGRGEPSAKRDGRLFWALEDITFDIGEGEIVGVIGRNGAGKTTLLKILTRITRPTKGHADIHGRIGSLLEVGTGFHPELTGRENVYFNGGILGMRKREIDAKFDEIVEFAETGRFVDTVVKRYSSGMQVRLAFAVAAHLDPEILVVDEVLSVGDLKFQRKCLEKMADVAQSGRTILFVSHQMNQIRRLCDRVLWIDGGHIKDDGPASVIVSEYESSASDLEDDLAARDGVDRTGFTRWWLSEAGGERGHVIDSSWEPLEVTFRMNATEAIRSGHFGIALYDSSGTLVWGSGEEDLRFDPGTHELSLKLPLLPVRPGNYRWRVSIWEYGKMLDLWDATPELLVATEPVTHWIDQFAGVLNVPAEFSARQVGQ